MDNFGFYLNSTNLQAVSEIFLSSMGFMLPLEEDMAKNTVISEFIVKNIFFPVMKNIMKQKDDL